MVIDMKEKIFTKEKTEDMRGDISDVITTAAKPSGDIYTPEATARSRKYLPVKKRR